MFYASVFTLETPIGWSDDAIAVAATCIASPIDAYVPDFLLPWDLKSVLISFTRDNMPGDWDGIGGLALPAQDLSWTDLQARLGKGTSMVTVAFSSRGDFGPVAACLHQSEAASSPVFGFPDDIAWLLRQTSHYRVTGKSLNRHSGSADIRSHGRFIAA